MKTKIELLSPARDADIGIEAIRHGADAVYIGAPSFSARAAAGCSVADIARLADYAHQYRAHVLVALNTILNDDELDEARRLAWRLHDAGVDGLIVQDLGLLAVDMPPLPLHASTQMDTRTPQKARLLQQLGFRRVVLARELSLSQIRAVREATEVELECFVHGALCVSVSGQCYMSQCLMGRSANRGVCAQPCRLPMEAFDAHGRRVGSGHLLSLRDMNRAARLEDLIAAGVTSLKIEGRLKDVAYVKNVTAYYRRALDDVLERHPEWAAASDGAVVCDFQPRLGAAFNRGFTDYYLDGVHSVRSRPDAEPVWNFATPKSMGERVGTLTRVGRDWIEVSTSVPLHNGDGLLCVRGDVADARATAPVGFRLNRVDPSTARLFPLGGADVVRSLDVGMAVWRNHDHQLAVRLERPSATRRVPVDMTLAVDAHGATLSATLPAGVATVHIVPPDGHYEWAERPQLDNYRRQLAKLGDTSFELARLEVVVDDAPSDGRRTRFVPSSQLSELRRLLVAQMTLVQAADVARQRGDAYAASVARRAEPNAQSLVPQDARANVMNGKSRRLMANMGIDPVAPAYELRPDPKVPVMVTRHCLRYALDQCPRYRRGDVQHIERQRVRTDDWTLKIGDHKFLIKFGCQNDCMSEIFTIFAPNSPKP